MKFQPINPDGDFPQGGWIFTDPRTGYTLKDGDRRSVARQMIAHRLANPKIYSSEDGKWLDFDSVLLELGEQTCNRIGNNYKFCKQVDAKAYTPQNVSEGLVVMPSPCRCGETLGKEKYCATCGGKKVVGYICSKCGYLKSK